MEDPWIISSDGQNAVEFVLYGKGVTPPKKAVMANKDLIDLATPITLFNPGNTFNSILSYNDSALALFWDPVEIAKDSSVSFSYIINLSDSDFQNSGRTIFEEVESEPEEVEEKEDDKEPVPEVKDKALHVDQALPGETKAPEATAPIKEEFNTAIEGVDPSKLNMDYVQQLINHINSLEQGDPSLNKMKIQQLQTEVDEVLKVLRSRQ